MHVLDGEARGDRSGTVLADHFDLLKKIGSGGMGDVYEARFRPDRRRYALKLLTGAPARDPILVARFEHEYQRPLPHEAPPPETPWTSQIRDF
ncbi:MAG TPA: hypothetical protein PKW35_05275 [Nannocystaceae bacterium]|nr:hypothetical protein [Nannocystaceae bacterium]